MEETIRLTKSSSNRVQQRAEFGDDECSTDSGCSSGSSSGGSSSSAEHLSRCRNGDRESLSSHRHNCYVHHHGKGHRHNEPATTRSQERLSRCKFNGHRGRTTEASRSWSPSESRYHMKMSPSHSSSPSDNHSTDSDSSKKAPKTEILRRALQCLKIGKCENNGCKEKKLTKKSPKRILREPVLYTYVRGLSGLPTQRVPRNTVQQFGAPCSCQDTISLYRSNPDRR